MHHIHNYGNTSDDCKGYNVNDGNILGLITPIAWSYTARETSSFGEAKVTHKHRHLRPFW